ncbi:MAG: zinc-binding dehydrogenase [Desulfitobacterium sp.]
MRALKITGPQKIEVKEVVTPVVDGKNVLIKVNAVGICGSDLNFFRKGHVGAEGCTSTPGHEFCGTVVDPGANQELKVGDRVVVMEINPCGGCEFCKAGRENLCMNTLLNAYGSGAGNGPDGGMAEYALIRPDMVIKLPDNINDIEASLIEPASIAMHGILRANANRDSRVLITGCGPIGLLCAAICQAMGVAQIVMTEVNEERIRFAQESGYADKILNGAEPALKDELKAMSEGGFTHVFECTGVEPVAAMAMSTLRNAGHFQIVAMHGNLTISMVMISLKEIDIRGGLYFLPEDFQRVIDLMAQGKLKVEQLATRIATFEEAQACFEDLTSGKTNNAKIVLRP